MPVDPDPGLSPKPGPFAALQEFEKGIAGITLQVHDELFIQVRQDGDTPTIPLAMIGPTERRLVPVASPALEAVENQKVINALNRAVATREMDGYVNTSDEAKDATKKLIWRHWTEQHRQRNWHTTNSCTNTDDIWDHWIPNTSTASTTIWDTWATERSCYKHRDPIRRVPSPPPTPEEIAARIARETAIEIERKTRVSMRETAMAKAEKLLMSALNPKQQEELKSKRYFHCKSQKGVVYRIYKGTHGNVKRLDERGREVESLCIQPDNVPDFDAMLAQKLHIEFNEDGFRKTANITRLLN